jgi:glycerol-3-phosphate acyltransferase PlsY
MVDTIGSRFKFKLDGTMIHNPIINHCWPWFSTTNHDNTNQEMGWWYVILILSVLLTLLLLFMLLIWLMCLDVSSITDVMLLVLFMLYWKRDSCFRRNQFY